MEAERRGRVRAASALAAENGGGGGASGEDVELESFVGGSWLLLGYSKSQ